MQKAVRELEMKEQKAFMSDRNDKINLQLVHMQTKQKSETNALTKKIDSALNEADTLRKKEQEVML